ncbi:MAG: hypothetical protein IIC00_15005 [Planctomycetes bacterium]|nr:hypothetical protein [Planctomycetota bacterium]
MSVTSSGWSVTLPPTATARRGRRTTRKPRRISSPTRRRTRGRRACGGEGSLGFLRLGDRGVGDNDQRLLAVLPIVDAHVPAVKNYKAGGVSHHNSGKTVAAGYELTVHLTGLYPHWWEGRRFSRPVNAWAVGETNKTTRDILQRKLLGKITGAGTNKKSVDGTGLIPGDNLGKPNWEQGISDNVDTIQVLHTPTGKWSTLGFKSYFQGAGSFEGTEQQVIQLDEEPPIDVYGECLIRTTGNIAIPDSSGIIMLSFTPKLGLSDVVLSFMPEEDRPGFGDAVKTELG